MPFSSIIRSVMSLLVGMSVLFFMGSSVAENRSPLATIDNAAQQLHLTELRTDLEQLTHVPDFKLRAPASRAKVSLLAMYSAQQGSWPFEPFVHNGLFRAIAGYQSNHPRAVVIRGGSITVQQLHAQLANDSIISRHEDGYLLNYPLLIEPDAALVLEDTTLYMYSYSGTALINRGLLSINRAALKGFSDGRPHATDRPSRPFVMNWAGSSLRIQSSEVSGLGYDENLSRGMTATRSVHQNASAAPVRVLINDSHFTDMTVGLALSGGVARIVDSHFEQMQQYALDLDSARFLIKGNRVDTVRDLSGIRIAGRSQGMIEDNRLLRAGKSAVEVAHLDGGLIIRSNQIGAIEGYGLLLRDAGAETRMLIENNMIGNTRLTAIDGGGLSHVSIVGNRIQGVPEYAISIRNSQPAPGPLWITGNHLENIGKAMLRVQGIHQTVLGDNRYLANPLLQNLLIGDLLPYQSTLLEMTLRQGAVVGLELEKVSLLPLPTEG